MSPIAVPMVPAPEREFVAEWWEVRSRLDGTALLLSRTRAELDRDLDEVPLRPGERVVHVRRYRKVKK